MPQIVSVVSILLVATFAAVRTLGWVRRRRQTSPPLTADEWAVVDGYVDCDASIVIVARKITERNHCDRLHAFFADPEVGAAIGERAFAVRRDLLRWAQRPWNARSLSHLDLILLSLRHGQKVVFSGRRVPRAVRWTASLGSLALPLATLWRVPTMPLRRRAKHVVTMLSRSESLQTKHTLEDLPGVSSGGALMLEDNGQLRGAATAALSIEMGIGAQAQSLRAPCIATERAESLPVAESVKIVRGVVIPGSVAEPGYDPKMLYNTVGGPLRYAGDLRTDAAVHLKQPLIVEGDFRCGGRSLLATDLKAYGDISVGAESIVTGNLLASGSITLKPACVFQAILRAGRNMRLCTSSQGMRRRVPVAACAGGAIAVEPGVTVWGKLWSAKRVVAVRDR